MKFDISGIPDGATINSIEFHGYVNAANYPYWNINPVTNDPVTTSPSVLYSDIMAETNSGYYLYRSEASSYSTGWKVHILGGNANANLQAALTQNWFAIGIMDRDGSSSYYIGFDGWSQTNKPFLVVDYTYTSPYSWLKVNGSGTTSGTVQPGINQQITVGFEAGTLALGTYNANIKITSNDPVDPQVMIPCTLNITTGTTINLTAMLEGLYNGAGTMRKAQDESGNHFTGNTADHITVELHNSATYSTIEYAATDIALSTAGTATFTVPANKSGSYYVTIKHRNSIETTSALPVNFSGTTISYTFNTQAKAYGNNMGLIIDGAAVIYAGDTNQDGIVDGSDLSAIANLATIAASGYISEDLNGDGLIDGSDLAIAGNDADAAVGAVLP